MGMNLIFLGPPGAGKGTVAQHIMKKYGLIQISTGDLLRTEISSGSELGLELSKIINAGELVGDKLVGELLLNELKKRVSTPNFNGFIFDGFPRTESQAPLLEKILKKVNQKLTGVIYIDSSKENIVKRLSSRWTCEKCKKVYNTISLPPKKEGKCDEDEGKLIQRDDDKPETISNRFDTFIQKTSPLTKYYENKNILFKYDGNVPPLESIKLAEEIVLKIMNSQTN